MQARDTKTDDNRRTITLPGTLERDRLIDSGQAAAMLGFSLPHFRRLYRSGKVPQPVQIGERKYGWPAGALSDWVAAKAQEVAQRRI